MIYIVGADHPRQFGCGCGDEYSQSKFKDFLNKFVSTNNIEVIAEEASQKAKIEGCSDGCEGNVAYTIPEDIARKFKLLHIFADPNIEERERMGIKLREDIAKELGVYKPDGSYSSEELLKINLSSRPYDKLREKEWLKRISIVTNRNTLFICGYEHAEHFVDLLQNNKINCRLIQIFK